MAAEERNVFWDVGCEAGGVGEGHVVVLNLNRRGSATGPALAREQGETNLH